MAKAEVVRFVGGPKHGDEMPRRCDKEVFAFDGVPHAYFRDGTLMVHSSLWADDMRAWRWSLIGKPVWFPITTGSEVAD